MHAVSGGGHLDGCEGNDTMAFPNTADKLALFKDGDGWKVDFFGVDYLSNFEIIKFGTVSSSLAEPASHILLTRSA